MCSYSREMKLSQDLEDDEGLGEFEDEPEGEF